MNLVRSSLLAAVTAAAVLAPAAAYADAAVTSDPKGDVLVYSGDSETPTKDPSVTQGDIVSSAVDYGPRRVTLAVHFRDLAMSGDGFYSVFRIRTNEGRLREVDLFAGPGQWSGTTETVNARHDKVRCRGVRHNIYYTANLARISIPSRCLSRPRWVETAIGAVDIKDPKFFVDDANTDGKVYDEPVWGTRVYR
jgi:hypothetical protein